MYAQDNNPLPVWIILSQAHHHISTNSQPFLVGIVSSISEHRNAYVSMQACTEHVEYQLPNEHSCNGFLLEAIQNSDPGLQAAMASVRMDTGDGGK